MSVPRTVLLTAADHGVGRTAALLLAERGLRVLACGTDPEGLADLPRETGAGGIIELHRQPLEDLPATRDAVARAQSLFGPLRGLVVAGGERIFGPIEETPEEIGRQLMEANYFRPLRLIQAAAPALRGHGSGTIVCVSSAAGRVALPMSGAYCASLYALEGLCDALRMELGVFGIHVVLIEPGLVRERVVSPAHRILPGEIFRMEDDSPYAAIAEVLAGTLAQLRHRAATPQQVAETIHRALSARHPRARYAVSRSAAALLWARKILPDRFLDNRLAKRMGLSSLD